MADLASSLAPFEAERLRLTLLVGRQRWRAVLGLVALMFLLFGFAGLHVSALIALAPLLPPLTAALVVMGADIVFAAVFGVLAARDQPGRLEREALELRTTAVSQLGRQAAAELLSSQASVMLISWLMRRMLRRRP